jgi:peptide-methionine (S)-S-oxide reductase
MMDQQVVNQLEKATFGAGCFWHVEQAFQRVKGVMATWVGYMGGTLADPTYEDVCTGTTGHAEVVEVTFDPTKVTYDNLLDIFWNIHDPTTLNRQGPDRGTQYRSVIFVHSPEQKEAAEASKKRHEQSLRWGKKIVTEITTAGTFYRAEEYHQKYLDKNGHKACRL